MATATLTQGWVADSAAAELVAALLTPPVIQPRPIATAPGRGTHGPHCRGLCGAPHGKAGTYNNHGCRCPECTTAACAAKAVSTARAKKRVPPDKVHGTLTGYSYWGCRCDPCCGAESTYRADLHARRAVA